MINIGKKGLKRTLLKGRVIYSTDSYEILEQKSYIRNTVITTKLI